MHCRISLAIWISCVVLVGGCGTDPNPSGPDSPDVPLVKGTFLVPPDLAVYREVSETEWKPLPMVTPTSFELSPKGPYIITAVCDEIWPGSMSRDASISQIARTLDDPREIDIYCNRIGPHHVTTGFAPKTGVTLYRAWVSLGWYVNSLPGFNFQFWVEDGTYDFLAIANEKVYARRGIAISSDMELPPFDLNLEGTHAPRHNITVLNVAPTDTRMVASTDWFTRDGYLFLHSANTLSTPFTVAPASMLMPDDVQVLSAATLSGQSWREIRRSYREGDSRELTLPDYVDSFMWSHDSGVPVATWTELPQHDRITALIWGVSATGPLTYSYQHLNVSRSFEKVMGVSSLALDTDIPGYKPQWRIDLSKHNIQQAAIERDDGNDTARSGMDFSFNEPPMMPVGAPDPRDIDRRSTAWRLRRTVTHGAD